MSAKIVEEAGFKGIWASSLTLSASLGMQDNNELSPDAMIHQLDYMNEATSLPTLVDGDTGYADIKTFERYVRKLEQRGIAGICIEDKIFPKRNSFLQSETQRLVGIEEFCEKIRAGKEVRKDEDFCVIARVEAFIVGWGVEEAIRRAEAYREAGADAVLIHSKEKTSIEIEAFMTEWGNRHPVVIIPTTYSVTPTEHFRELGISTVIWANQLLRASVKAMQATAHAIHESENAKGVESKIAALAEIFRLQGVVEPRNLTLK